MNGSWREMVVEAAWGLGEGLVSGRVTPHWFLVRRPRKTPRPVERALARVRLQLVQEDLPELSDRWVVRADGRVGPEPVPASLRGRPTLDRSTLYRLCRLGLRVERALGGPQDVEWALGEDGRLTLLQARPITTTGTPRVRQDVLWTRRFLGERWPEPTTPLGWSLLSPILDRFIAYPEVQARHLGGGPALRLIRSRPYLNATVFNHLAFKAPGAPAPRFMLELLPPEQAGEWHRRHAVMPNVAVYASIIKDTIDKRRWRRFRWNPFTNHRAWDDFEAQFVAALPGLQRTPVSEADCLRLVDAQLDLVERYIGVHVCSLLFANLWDQVLESLLAVWLPERAAEVHGRLSTSPPGNATVRTNAALAELAREATEADLDALGAGRPPSSGFADRLEAFLAVFGQRSESSWEIFSPRWAERPSALVPLMRMYRLAEAEDPAVMSARQERGFAEARAEVEAAVGDSLRGWVLGGVIHLVRRYTLLRENQRFQFDHLLFALQRSLRWLGDRFAERQWLESGADVAYLTVDEVRGLVGGELDPAPIRASVDRRRQQREADLLVQPPVFLWGDEEVVSDATGARLQGMGISPGRVRAPVRLVRSLAEGHRLKAGEILVTHSVDPAWTPLFQTAGGVILELGSRLSHGAVVAREYGVPAAVNFDGVMSKLRDGQEVTLDGTRGVVWLHP